MLRPPGRALTSLFASIMRIISYPLSTHHFISICKSLQNARIGPVLFLIEVSIAVTMP
jgi:hypothetical protein